MQLIHGDCLRARLPRRGPYAVFASIPYHLTTQIVDRLTLSRNPPERIWLVIERGAALRFMGQSRPSRRAQYLRAHWDCEIVHAFRRSDFHPTPSVESVLFQMIRRPRRRG